MEKESRPFPEIDLFPRLTRVAKAIGNLFQMHLLASHGDHFVENRGGPALDRELYEINPDQIQLDYEAQARRGW